MKYLILFSTILFAAVISSAQSDIQIIKIKNDDRSISISAINNSEITFTLEVKLILEGLKLESPIPPSINLIPGQESQIALLIPTASKTNYKIQYRATAIEDGENVAEELTVPDVTIYTINSHEKSTHLRQYLLKNEIPFNEVNVSYSDKKMKVYENMLNRRGISKSAAKFPVVIIKGEVYYSIEDVNKFIEMKF